MAPILGTVVIAVLAIFVVAALVAPIANLTTGLTISHTGFVPNANVTSSTPGIGPILQLYPIFFIFIGLLYVAKVAMGGGIDIEDSDIPEEPELESKLEYYYPPWNCANCAGPNPENHPMCQYCGEAYEPRAVKYS